MLAKQLAFLPPIDEKEVRNTIIRELKRYKALKVQLENRKEREEAGMNNLFPQLRDQHFLNELKVCQMDRALKQSLDDDELQIIKAKYLSSKKIKDIEIYMEMGLKKDKYYQIKRQAINNLATALGII
ncbi:ArpU family phage packaging/lysis transcriptional regulator [Bacillus sp. NSP9.1]|uniref:ArpU family phage packaging/lysis transcriptional regulator n=1 Tax=Bacillus sp. NSP9.1 TaxID=1071078 RepID=UPI0003F7D7B8|nr:ArpU family phage packaging/lysis transcriptional regulator [Bacillus sp. NSP9.1]QHZ46354.1 ArpU family transcriptional regulator [Bacillus sp. NSP9.1]